MTGRLGGLTAVVNGAGRGIGRAIAMEFAAEGAQVLVNDLGTESWGPQVEPDRANGVVAEIVAAGGDAIADQSDIGDLDQARELIERAVSVWGKLDILVNCAGILRYGSATDTPPEDWDAQIRTHLRGYYNTSTTAAKHWLERGKYGRLINFTSDAADGLPSLLAYSTAKAGVVGFTRSFANAMVSYNVTANCVRPIAATGMIDMLPQYQRSGERPSAAGVGTMMDPRNVAPLVLFLASPAASHVTARTFTATGGRYTLLTDPTEERVVEANFLTQPADVYAQLERSLCAGLRLEDLQAPMPPLAELGDWKDTYGAVHPVWDFGRSV